MASERVGVVVLCDRPCIDCDDGLFGPTRSYLQALACGWSTASFLVPFFLATFITLIAADIGSPQFRGSFRGSSRKSRRKILA
jgi:hypothetical protein